MKKALKIILGLVILAAIALPLLRMYTKSHSPEVTAEYNQGGLALKVKYCQPAKKGREIFGKLVPYKQVWRTGANEATEITFSQDVKWGDKPVKAGTYTLFTIPDETQWTAILNKVTGQWGAYNYKPAENVAETSVKSETLPAAEEKLSLSFAPAEGGADLVIAWDKTKVVVPIRK